MEAQGTRFKLRAELIEGGRRSEGTDRRTNSKREAASVRRLDTRPPISEADKADMRRGREGRRGRRTDGRRQREGIMRNMLGKSEEIRRRRRRRAVSSSGNRRKRRSQRATFFLRRLSTLDASLSCSLRALEILPFAAAVVIADNHTEDEDGDTN